MASSVRFSGTVILILLLLFPAFLLHAQNTNPAGAESSPENDGFFIDTSGIMPRFFQRLIWAGDEYALHYEVTIQRQSVAGGEYLEFGDETTKEKFLSVSLPPGKYRYCVTPVDLLGNRGDSSAWRQFEILTAFQPSIEKFYPPAFLLDRNIDRKIDLTGNNLLKESDIFLRSGNSHLFPLEIRILDNRRAILTFDDKTLVTGDYEIYIKNPGGLETSMTGFSVKYKKPLDLFIKSFWAPSIPIYGQMHEIFGGKFYPAGAGISFEAVSSKRAAFNGGFEFTFSGYSINSLLSFSPDYYDDIDALFSGALNGASWLSGSFNFLFQKQFLNKQMALTLRIGGGLGIMNLSAEMLLSFSSGLSYLLRLYDIFYLDLGADFTQYFGSENSGIIHPRLAVGWLF
ncbi:MAG: hypothetical protein LBH16_05330 [Treponema sp.]|jgi:hypothetical protein|nr:hypothetical protein [Treponema sp.]